MLVFSAKSDGKDVVCNIVSFIALIIYMVLFQMSKILKNELLMENM